LGRISVMSNPSIQLLLDTLEKRYSPLDKAGCLVIKEIGNTMTARFTYPVLLWKYFKGADKEQAFLDDLHNKCKDTTRVYGKTYYEVVRLMWLRFKEVGEPSRNGHFNTFVENLKISLGYKSVQERIETFMMPTMNIIDLMHIVQTICLGGSDEDPS
jgi:hypothetical protein